LKIEAINQTLYSPISHSPDGALLASLASAPVMTNRRSRTLHAIPAAAAAAVARERPANVHDCAEACL